MEKVNTPFIEITKPKKKLNPKVVLVFLVIVLVIFLITTYLTNKVKSIKVLNNNFLSEEYIKEIVGINTNTHYLFIFTSYLESQVIKNPLIDDIKIDISNHNSIVITVKENTIIGYQVSGNSINTKTKFILADGTMIDFDASYIKNIAMLPLFVDINETQIPDIAKCLAKIDFDILTRISEISNIAFTYDDNMLKLSMDDGYIVYASILGLPYIKDYLKIITNDTSRKNTCILIVEDYYSALLIDCQDIKSYQVQQ